MTEKPDERKFEFSYRIYIGEVGKKNAMEIKTNRKDGKPCSIAEVESSLHEAVENATGHFLRAEEGYT